MLLLTGPIDYAQAQIAFTIDKDSLAVEPVKGNAVYVLRVMANANPTAPVQVTVADRLTGDASPTQDYGFQPNPVVLTFGPGLQQTQFVGIEIKADAKDEPSETIHVKVSVPTGYTVGATDSYTVTISDADQETRVLSPFRIATGSNFDYLNNAAELKNLFFGFEVFAPTAFNKRQFWALTGFNIGFAWSQNFSADSSSNVRIFQSQAVGRISADCTLVRNSQFLRTSTTRINNFNFFASHLAHFWTNDAGTLETYFAIRFEGIRRNFEINYNYELDTVNTVRVRRSINQYPPFFDITRQRSRRVSYYDFYLSAGFPFKWEPQSDAVEFRLNPMLGYGWFSSPFHQRNADTLRPGQQREFDRLFYAVQLSIIEKKFGIRIGGEVRGSFGGLAPYYTVTLSKVFTFRKFEDYITLKK